MLAHDPRGEEAADQPQDALVGHPTAHLFHQETVMDRSEAVLDVSLYYPLIRARRVDEEPHFFDGVLRPAPGPKSVRGRAKVRLEDRLEHELGRRLHDPVAHRRDAQASELPRALRDQPLARRQRSVGATLELLSELVEDTLHAHLFDSRAGLAIDTGGPRPPVAFHPLPRDEQRRGVTDQVEQVTEARLLVLGCPSVQLGLPSQYPPPRRLRRRPRRAGIHRRLFWHDSLLHCELAARLRHVDGFPALGLLRGLRHAPRPSAGIGPCRAATSGPARTGRFPRSP